MQKEASTLIRDTAPLAESSLQYEEAASLKAYQWARLRETLEYLELHSPFYQHFFRQKGVKVPDIRSREDFSALPFTTKEDLQLHNSGFLCIPQNRVIDHCSTSGTMGEPVHILLSENDLQRLALNESMGLRMAGIGDDDVIQLTTTLDKRFMAGLAYWSGARKIGAGIIRNGSGVPGMQWDTILRFGATVMIAVPSFLLKLIEYAIAHGIDYKNSSVKKVICIGESIRNRESELNNLGQRIFSQWPVQLYSTYASTEMQTCFTECEAGMGGHLLPELIFPEIVDEEGHAVPDGENGELVITTLGIEGMPLLRYKTGDICSLNSKPCSCGRTTPRLSPVSGRKLQMLKIKGTTVYPAAVFNILDGMEEVEHYLLEAWSNENEGDELRIQVAYKPGADDEVRNLTEQKLHEGLRLKIFITTRSAEEILKLQFPEGSRKPIKFIDNRKN